MHVGCIKMPSQMYRITVAQMHIVIAGNAFALKKKTTGTIDHAPRYASAQMSYAPTIATQ